MRSHPRAREAREGARALLTTHPQLLREQHQQRAQFGACLGRRAAAEEGALPSQALGLTWQWYSPPSPSPPERVWGCIGRTPLHPRNFWEHPAPLPNPAHLLLIPFQKSAAAEGTGSPASPPCLPSSHHHGPCPAACAFPSRPLTLLSALCVPPSLKFISSLPRVLCAILVCLMTTG